MSRQDYAQWAKYFQKSLFIKTLKISKDNIGLDNGPIKVNQKMTFFGFEMTFLGFSNSVCVGTCKLKTWVLKHIILGINN